MDLDQWNSELPSEKKFQAVRWRVEKGSIARMVTLRCQQGHNFDLVVLLPLRDSKNDLPWQQVRSPEKGQQHRLARF